MNELVKGIQVSRSYINLVANNGLEFYIGIENYGAVRKALNKSVRMAATFQGGIKKVEI